MRIIDQGENVCCSSEGWEKFEAKQKEKKQIHNNTELKAQYYEHNTDCEQSQYQI